MSNPGDYYGMAETIEAKDKRIAELESTIDRVRVFATSHIHLENGAVFVKGRRNMFLAAIKGEKS